MVKNSKQNKEHNCDLFEKLRRRLLNYSKDTGNYSITIERIGQFGTRNLVFGFCPFCGERIYENNKTNDKQTR